MMPMREDLHEELRRESVAAVEIWRRRSIFVGKHELSVSCAVCGAAAGAKCVRLPGDESITSEHNDYRRQVRKDVASQSEVAPVPGDQLLRIMDGLTLQAVYARIHHTPKLLRALWVSCTYVSKDPKYPPCPARRGEPCFKRPDSWPQTMSDYIQHTVREDALQDMWRSIQRDLEICALPWQHDLLEPLRSRGLGL